eukprot:UN2738
MSGEADRCLGQALGDNAGAARQRPKDDASDAAGPALGRRRIHELMGACLELPGGCCCPFLCKQGILDAIGGVGKPVRVHSLTAGAPSGMLTGAQRAPRRAC